jgi:hypothetical protein
LAFSRSPVPHDPHATPAVIRAPSIQGSPPQLPKSRASTYEERFIDPRVSYFGRSLMAHGDGRSATILT